MLVGDNRSVVEHFNAHHVLWHLYYLGNDLKGSALVEQIDDLSFCILKEYAPARHTLPLQA